MIEKGQAVTESTTQPPAHDNEDQQRGDETLTAEERPDDAGNTVARRRASLDKEIRAGWQRALGH
jgi:hypothetical protein